MSILPDCMMPDGAEPCFAYQNERNRAVYWGRRALKAEAALRQIANGEGYYGAQALEYKKIARAALEQLGAPDPDTAYPQEEDDT